MTPKPFQDLDFERITITTPRGDIKGLFSDLCVDITTIPKGLIPYNIRHSDDDDSVPVTVETFVAVNYFGTILVNTPLDFGCRAHIEILEWDLNGNTEGCPEWIRKLVIV
jgi:hypothetical protein